MIFRRQRHHERQFQPVQGGFNPAERVAANHDFMRCERQMEQLLGAVAVQFGKRELIQRQQEYAPRRNFNAQPTRQTFS
jgi:hypothetical protein